MFHGFINSHRISTPALHFQTMLFQTKKSPFFGHFHVGACLAHSINLQTIIPVSVFWRWQSIAYVHHCINLSGRLQATPDPSTQILLQFPKKAFVHHTYTHIPSPRFRFTAIMNLCY